MTEAQREAQRLEFEQILIDELIFPAVCAAFHAEPGRWQERILTFELSASQIRDAYGRPGLAEWGSYFTPIRRGGCDRFGVGYKTMWRFNTGKYGFLLKLVRELGHDIKELPNPGFPPTAMLKRLGDFEARVKRRAEKKLAKRAELVQATANARADQDARGDRMPVDAPNSRHFLTSCCIAQSQFGIEPKERSAT